MRPGRGLLPRRGAWWWHALAAVFFLGCALWAMRVILPAPASTFPLPSGLPPAWQRTWQSDQKLTAANITWNAHRFLTRPWNLYDAGQCYPASDATTLGPHQLGEGLLGVLPYALTTDPVITYNTVVVLTLWLPALAMYALVFTFTGSVSGAFIAGLLFAFHPNRITNVIHPDVNGNHWTPLALLFAHRTFVSGRWRDAAGLTFFLALQVLGSIYQLLALAVLGGTYGIFLTVWNVRRLPVLAPKLAAAIGATALVAWMVLGPYLHTRATWGTLGGRATLLSFLQDFTPGRAAYPGSVLLILALIGLIDRWRGPRRRVVYDPRLAFLVAGLLVVWSAVWSVPIPGLAIQIPSLFTLAGRVLPGLDAIRAGSMIGFGAVLAGAVLAGYGVVALVERRSATVRAIVTTVLTVALLVEIFHPAASTYSFGRSVKAVPYLVRPPAPLLELYAKSPAGAVLDFPFSFDFGRFSEMADDVFLSAFHLHPVGTCYNSFKLPLQADIQHLAERLGNDPRAVDALHALGFGTLVVTEYRPGRKWNNYMIAKEPGGFTLLGRAAAHSAYRLESTAPVATGFAVLGAGSAPTAALTATPPEAALAFTSRNGPGATYRHPDPIEPTRVRLRWRAGGAVVREDEATMLLPIALAAGEEMSRVITVPVPIAAGEYEVTLAPAGTPDLVLARHTVQVIAAAAAPLERRGDGAAPAIPTPGKQEEP